MKWTTPAKNALFEDLDCDNYCHYRGGDLKKDAVAVNKRAGKPELVSAPALWVWPTAFQIAEKKFDHEYSCEPTSCQMHRGGAPWYIYKIALKQNSS